MDKTIDMAREAGFERVDQDVDEWICFTGEIERLVELVRADERNRTWTQEHWTEYKRSIAATEREACAKVCDELHWPWHIGDNSGPKECAKAIRARGNT